ncbi:IS3 family transposase [Candidatus Protochlamydia sp. W-9]|uniref:IS3 family transposase n=1 Tax=Candidatus Protochlamydia sp. W-9 TaxID=1785087 RepID=UPI0009AC1010|nr:IS3 family transposase [Candidatus Protochlamydia sp. W-9]
MSKRQGDEQVKVLIQTVALERPRFDYRRIHFILKKRDFKINHKKLFKLYQEMGLKVRKRGARRRGVEIRLARIKASQVNEILCRIGLQMERKPDDSIL